MALSFFVRRGASVVTTEHLRRSASSYGIRGVDFSQKGPAAPCRAELRCDPMSGTVFVFRNRRATAVRLLVYDGQGFWLCHKRLSSGAVSRRITLFAGSPALRSMLGDRSQARAQAVVGEVG